MRTRPGRCSRWSGSTFPRTAGRAGSCRAETSTGSGWRWIARAGPGFSCTTERFARPRRAPWSWRSPGTPPAGSGDRCLLGRLVRLPDGLTDPGGESYAGANELHRTLVTHAVGRRVEVIDPVSLQRLGSFAAGDGVYIWLVDRRGLLWVSDGQGRLSAFRGDEPEPVATIAGRCCPARRDRGPRRQPLGRHVDSRPAADLGEPGRSARPRACAAPRSRRPDAAERALRRTRAGRRVLSAPCPAWRARRACGRSLRLDAVGPSGNLVALRERSARPAAAGGPAAQRTGAAARGACDLDARGSRSRRRALAGRGARPDASGHARARSARGLRDLADGGQPGARERWAVAGSGSAPPMVCGIFGRANSRTSARPKDCRWRTSGRSCPTAAAASGWERTAAVSSTSTARPS